jgi:CRP/FNR family transcriptional regulator, cyclic AMP receptor protein
VPREYLNDNRACSRPVFPALLRKFLESSFRTEFFPNGTRLPHCCPAGRPDGYQASDLGPGFSDQGFRAELSHPENWQTVPQDKTIEPRQVISSKLAVLRAHPIFCDLDADAFEQLGRYAKPATLKRGATIFSKGDPGNSLIAVVSGTVKISISSPDGRSAILNLIGPGEIFGEVAVLDGQARTADATANSNCEIVVIDRREFLPFVRSQPSLAMKFIELLCTRLRWTSDQVEQVILQDLPGRLASALIRLTERRKATKDGRTIAVTQQEISEMVGMSRESINKQLRAWSMRNWVRLEHGAIVVLDLGPLQEIAGTALEDD